MIGGFIAFRCGNYENTAEREQFRALCKNMKKKYAKSENMCFLIGNYNIFDSEFDAILIKNDAIIAIEFKNYGGTITAVENGDWTSNGTKIIGGSRKTVYQQARVNHASLRNGLKELGINEEWIKDLPSIIVFNKLITLDNRLSNKVQSWLHITDNAHFTEKVDDITCRFTNMSNSEMIDLAIKLNLNSFIDKDLSSVFSYEKDKKEDAEQVLQNDTEIEDIHTSDKCGNEIQEGTDIKENALTDYDRFTPNHVFSLRPGQIFVFGTDKWGSQKYGAAGWAAKKFGAQIGITEGATGFCYALPTKGFSILDLKNAVNRFKDYVDSNPQFTYLITPVGCGHAGFNVNEISALFGGVVTYKNVMLPKVFIDEYKKVSTEAIVPPSYTIRDDENPTERLIKFLKTKGKTFNESGTFALKDGKGDVIAEAELGIESDKIVFFPFNIQSANTFKNYGYSISTPEEYINSRKEK